MGTSSQDQRWDKLLSEGRQAKGSMEVEAASAAKQAAEGRTRVDAPGDGRVSAEADYDRILFSTPVRRLADKTQVFPLERNDSVRNRLTHSLEVSNLCRSLGIRLVAKKGWAADPKGRSVPATLAAAGLCHDLGNPPFGHKGEAAMQSWFAKSDSVFVSSEAGTVDSKYRDDFLKFEGNAQTFRLLARLQRPTHDTGLRLTFGTLSAMSKYTVSSRWKSENGKSAHCARKKHGFFESERDIAEQVFAKVGLSEGARHPLAFLMEACDDICYSMIDAEDVVKKCVVSVQDLISFLKTQGKGDPCIANVVNNAEMYFDEYRYPALALSSREINDVTTQRIRVDVVSHCLDAAFETFLANESAILAGTHSDSLLEKSKAARLVDVLKAFDKLHAYDALEVRRLELQGHNEIRELMTLLWEGILHREHRLVTEEKRPDPFAEYAYSRISESYRCAYEDMVKAKAAVLPVRYYSLQLLGDMVSGMTDSYLGTLVSELRRYKRASA